METTNDRLLTAGEAAEVLRIPSTRLARLARQGIIPRVELPGGDLRFSEKELWRWIERQKKAADDHASTEAAR